MSVDNRAAPETTKDLVSLALTAWEDLTETKVEEAKFSFRDFSAHDMNRVMMDAMKLDPSGTTTYMLLELFLRRYLEAKTFTAAQIMKDYAATTAYLQDAEALFKLVQSDDALEIASTFRNLTKAGVTRYGADTPAVLEMIDDPDVLPFLRRDALHSIEELTPFQFLKGAPDDRPAQVVDTVYIAWDINDLLRSVRDMPVSGIATVLLRDPTNPDRSFFVCAMRNGENVTLLTDKSRPAYPGQEDVLAGRGGRGAGRTFEKRQWENHFPYQLIKTHHDERGDLVFESERLPVASGLDMAPLMKISDLEPHQTIWLSMMMSLVSDKFWKAGWQAPALSYTGAMVKQKDLLVTSADGKLPAYRDYQPISFDRITLSDVSADEVTSELSLKRDKGAPIVNAWMEERYAASVKEDVLNVWHAQDTQHMLPTLEESRTRKQSHDIMSDNLVAYSKSEVEKLPFWKKPTGYKLNSVSPMNFGTEKELREDWIYTARHNLAHHIQRAANREYAERNSEIKGWYINALRKNLHQLLLRAASPDAEHDKILRFGEAKGSTFEYSYCYGNVLSDISSGKYLCPVTGAATSYRALFDPQTAEDIASLTGLEVADLPDVIQHWTSKDPYTGNHLLNRLDPVECIVESPWKKFAFDTSIYLSKRGYAKLQKGIIPEDLYADL